MTTAHEAAQLRRRLLAGGGLAALAGCICLVNDVFVLGMILVVCGWISLGLGVGLVFLQRRLDASQADPRNRVQAAAAGTANSAPESNARIVVAGSAATSPTSRTSLGREAAVAQLREQGIDLAAPNPARPPLEDAILDGEIETVRLLIAAGVDVNRRFASTNTPLIEAAEAPFEIVELLLEAKANPRPQNARDYTALHFAARAGKSRTIEALVRAGASVAVRHDGGDTPLLEAARYGKREAAELLVRLGASWDETDRDGTTARQLLALREAEDAAEVSTPVPTAPAGEVPAKPPALDREKDSERVLGFVRENFLPWLPVIDQSALEAHIRESNGLSPSLYDTWDAALAVIESEVGRMRRERAFWRFFVHYMKSFQCWHILSSHEDEHSQYRKHVVVWKVDARFAVAVSDNLWAFDPHIG